MKDVTKYVLLVITFNLLPFGHPAMAQQQSEALAKQMVAIEKKYSRLLPVGLSISEVKAKLGNPYAVQAGFPDTEESIIDEIPEFHGQLNYTTFLYKLGSTLKHSYKVESGGEILGGGATVDGLSVDRDLWDKYQTLDTVFFRFSRVVIIRWANGSLEELQTDFDYSDRFSKGDSVIPYRTVPVLDMWRLSRSLTSSGFVFERMLDSIVYQEVIEPTEIRADRIAKRKKDCQIIEIPKEDVPVKTETKTLTLKPLLFVLFDRGTQVLATTKILFLK